MKKQFQEKKRERELAQMKGDVQQASEINLEEEEGIIPIEEFIDLSYPSDS